MNPMALKDKVLTFEQDVEITHGLVHGADDATVETEGGELRTFAKLQKDLEEDLNSAAAITETGQNRQATETALSETLAAKTETEQARDAAQLSAGIWKTISAGLQGTTSDEYFSVPSDDSAEYLVLFYNNAGTAEEVNSYPSAAALDAAHQTIADAQSAQVQMATQLVRTQAMIAEHHAFT